MRHLLMLICFAVGTTALGQAPPGSTTLVNPVKITPTPVPFTPGQQLSVAVDFVANLPTVGSNRSLSLRFFVVNSDADPISNNAAAVASVGIGNFAPNFGEHITQTLSPISAPSLTKIKSGQILMMKLSYGENAPGTHKLIDKLIGTASFPLKCAKGKIGCKFQTAEMWRQDAIHKAESTTH